MVVDHVGAQTWQSSLKSLVKGGRVVTCSATTGYNPETDINRIFWNSCRSSARRWRPGQAEEALELVWDGTFEPSVHDGVEIPIYNPHGESQDLRTKISFVNDQLNLLWELRLFLQSASWKQEAPASSSERKRASRQE